MRDSPRVMLARQSDIMQVAERLGIAGLKRVSREWVGPCPVCGGRQDRLQINPAKGCWICRGCGGGDVISLVSHALACDFKAAVAWLVGDEDVALDPAEVERRAREAAARERDRQAREERERARAIAQAREIWRGCRPAAGTAVTHYLRLRGLPGWIADAPPDVIRFHPDLPYMVQNSDGRGYRCVHRGPAMVAACLSPGGHLTSVHRTWLDLTRAKGKAKIGDGGEVLPAKKVWGSKKGCAIRLTDVRGRDFTTLVMGEGIETTLTARAADAYPRAAYWAGIDLGNMAGQRVLRGTGMKFAGVPDLTDRDAFLPPPWVTWLVYVQDGDSDPQLTRAKLEAGLRRARAMRPALRRISIVHPGAGADLNDLILQEVHHAA